MGVTDLNNIYHDYRDHPACDADDRNDERRLQQHMAERGATQIGVALFVEPDEA